MSHYTHFSVRVPPGPVIGRHYAAARPKACVVIQAAVGMVQSRYCALATHLLARDISVITYDYSGIGWSKASRPSDCRRMPSLWGREDQTAVLDWARAHYPSVPLVVLGHSVGGQIVGFSPRVLTLDGIVLVCAQSPYVGHWRDPVMLARVCAIWFGLFPSASRLFGYLPGRLYGGSDLTRAACQEGRRWAMSASALFDEPDVRARLAAVDVPVRAYSFTDDSLLAPQAAVDALVAAFTGTKVERVHLAPQDIGLRRIGHLGFFAPTAKPLWEQLVTFVQGLAVTRQPRRSRSHT